MEDLSGEATVEIPVPQLVHLGAAPGAAAALRVVFRAQRDAETLERGPRPLSPAPCGRGGIHNSALVRDYSGGSRAACRAEGRASRDLGPARRASGLGRHVSKLTSSDAGAPHYRGPRPRLPAVGAARLAVPRSARLSGASSEERPVGEGS